MKPAISVRGLGKEYRLGSVHTDLLSEKLGNGLRAIGNRLRPNANHAAAATPKNERDVFWALKDVNFDVQPGEVLGVIGRNGAGKSTLLKILSRITAPTTGEIQLQGRVASLLEVGTGFHPELTGRENVFLNGAILGMTRQEIGAKFDEIVAFAEVEKFIDTPVKRYSSGMYVRLAFAVAAHLEPEILVVDEVLAVGDLAFQKKCLNKMEDVSNRGRTVIFVSHNMTSIKRLCDSAILIDRGLLIESGAPIDLVTSYYRNSQPSILQVNVPRDKHKWVTGFRINQLQILDENESLATKVLSGQPIKFRLEFESDNDHQPARVGIEIYREGILICNTHSQRSVVSVGKRYSAICELPGGVLMPGFYDVHIGAHDPDTDRGLDWLPDIMSFQILDATHKPAGEFDSKDRGLVRVSSDWRLEQ